MAQMTEDMARRIIEHWERERTHYGITAWEECQLAHAFLRLKELSTTGRRVVPADHTSGCRTPLHILNRDEEMNRAPKLTAEEFLEILRAANRYEWCLRNPGLAGLFMAEATNRDTFEGFTPTDTQIAAHINERIDEAMLKS